MSASQDVKVEEVNCFPDHLASGMWSGPDFGLFLAKVVSNGGGGKLAGTMVCGAASHRGA